MATDERNLRSVILAEARTKELVHVFLGGPWQNLVKTGYVTREFLEEARQMEEARHAVHQSAIVKALAILAKHHTNARLSTNANGMNYIEVTLEAYSLRGEISGNVWMYRDKQWGALKELCANFDMNLIFGDSLTRWCFNRDLSLDHKVEIDDGGC